MSKYVAVGDTAGLYIEAFQDVMPQVDVNPTHEAVGLVLKFSRTFTPGSFANVPRLSHENRADDHVADGSILKFASLGTVRCGDVSGDIESSVQSLHTPSFRYLIR